MFDWHASIDTHLRLHDCISVAHKLPSIPSSERRGQMSFTTHHSNARDQGLNSINEGGPIGINNPFPQTKPLGCTNSGSDFELSPAGWTNSECTSCFMETTPAECCWFTGKAEERLGLPGCGDHMCDETICEECSNHQECCDDCVVDCESDCGISFGVEYPYAFECSDTELFGDQTAQTFGLGRSLPQLATENTIIESNEYDKTLNDSLLDTAPGYSKSRNYPSPSLQQSPSFQIPSAPHIQCTLQEAISPIRSMHGSAIHRAPNLELTLADIVPHTSKNTPCMYSSASAHIGPEPIGCTANAHHDHIDLSLAQDGSIRLIPPCLRCQWADSNGEPCGKTLRPGEDMHEHLKVAHCVKTEVFCRWIGCSVGVFGETPHRFASSVERHTWGHSGYRPYKCSACNEGFAAASVLKEHFTNIHERKKIFACDVCSHQCTSATNLKRHKDDKHSIERFQCEFCNRNGKRRLFPRGPNLARHFRNCKYVRAQFPEAAKSKPDWLPPGYKRGHHGMDSAKVTPPNYLSVRSVA